MNVKAIREELNRDLFDVASLQGRLALAARAAPKCAQGELIHAAALVGNVRGHVESALSEMDRSGVA
jgi:hypothetical protein